MQPQSVYRHKNSVSTPNAKQLPSNSMVDQLGRIFISTILLHDSPPPLCLESRLGPSSSKADSCSHSPMATSADGPYWIPQLKSAALVQVFFCFFFGRPLDFRRAMSPSASHLLALTIWTTLTNCLKNMMGKLMPAITHGQKLSILFARASSSAAEL